MLPQFLFAQVFGKVSLQEVKFQDVFSEVSGLQAVQAQKKKQFLKSAGEECTGEKSTDFSSVVEKVLSVSTSDADDFGQHTTEEGSSSSSSFTNKQLALSSDEISSPTSHPPSQNCLVDIGPPELLHQTLTHTLIHSRKNLYYNLGKELDHTDDAVRMVDKKQVFAGFAIMIGRWNEFAQKCFLLHERCDVYSQVLGFKPPSRASILGQKYRFELQESTSKALGVLFLLFPLGVIVTKTVEYINAPDLDWGHRVELPVAKKKTESEEEGQEGTQGAETQDGGAETQGQGVGQGGQPTSQIEEDEEDAVVDTKVILL